MANDKATSKNDNTDVTDSPGADSIDTINAAGGDTNVAGADRDTDSAGADGTGATNDANDTGAAGADTTAAAGCDTNTGADTTATSAHTDAPAHEQTEEVRIERMSYGADAIAHLESGKAVFVAGAVTGDVVQVSVEEDKPSFARARVVNVVEPSSLRATDIPCEFISQCGGCPWAQLNYEAQCDAKRAAVVDALVRTAHVEQSRAEDIVDECLPSERTWGYRNKIELAATRDDWGHCTVGFYRESTHEIVSPDACPLVHPAIERAPKALRGSLSYLQGSQDLGIYRVGVRSSTRTNNMDIALWTPSSAFPRLAAGRTVKVALGANSVERLLAEPGPERNVKKVEVLEGRGFWEENFCNDLFRVSAPSFFQVNTTQAEKIVNDVLAELDVEQGLRVADLYAGVGAFSIPLVHAGASVVAVEISGTSVRDLRRNADAIGVEFEDIVCDDVARALPNLGTFDAVVVDPPQAGLSSEVITAIADAKPQRVAYISCNPQTWARDVTRFEESGFSPVSAVPVDLFPQTYHVEVLSILTR